MKFEPTFGTAAPLVGMVHLPPLPGAPKAPDDGDKAMRAALDRAASDARALDRGGVDGIVIENFGDAPFYPDEVPPHVVAGVTRAATAVAAETDIPLGINVLRNDAEAALSIAAAVGADFVRVNVHTGARVTDQGIVQGRAHETLRLRDRLGVSGAECFTYGLDTPVLVGSGVTPETVADLLDVADGAIVGTALKRGGETTAPVDADRVADLVDAADAVR